MSRRAGSPAATGDASDRPALARIAGAVGALFVTQLAMAILPYGVGAIAPIVRERFDLTRGEVGLATTAVFTSIALLSIPMGRFADRVGVWRSLVLASVLVGGAAAAVATAGAFPVLLALLLVAGAGYAAVTPATNKGVLLAAPPSARGRAMGVKQMGVTSGGIVAAAVLPWAIQRNGWATAFLVTGVAIVAVGTGGALTYRRLVHRQGRAAPPAAPSATGAATGHLVRLGVVIGALVAVQQAVATYLTLYLVDVRDVSVTAAAGTLTVLHASGTAARVGWGWVSDRIGGSRWRTVALIGGTSAASLLALALVGRRLPAGAFVALVVVLGVSTQGGNAVFQTALAEADEARAGRASGIGMSVGFAGGILAPPAFGALVDAAGSYAPSLLAGAAVAAAASAAAARLASAHGRREAPDCI
jgi:nitrate/nitrite transporter NarK